VKIVCRLVTLSRRICALLLEGSGFKLLFVCVYLPYQKGSDNIDDFLYQLSVVESVMSQFSLPIVMLLLGGDFNTDFNRLSLQTTILRDFCQQSNIYRFYRAMHFSAKRGIAIACRLSVCL